MAFASAGVIVAVKIVSGTIDVPGIGANGFHVDSSGNLGIGGPTATSGPFQVSASGAVVAQAITVSGTITTSSLAWGTTSTLDSSDSLTLPTQTGFATPARVQTAQATAAGSSLTVTFAAAAAGDVLILTAGFGTTGASRTWNTPAGWTVLSTGSTANDGINLTGLGSFYRVATGGETSVTVTLSGVVGTMSGVVSEYSGLAAVPLDVNGGGNSGLTNSPRSGNFGPTTQTVELLVAGCAYGAGGHATFGTPIQSFQQSVNFNTPVQCSIVVWDRIVSTTGTYNGGADANTPPNLTTWVVNGASFKAAAVALTPAAGKARLYARQRSGTATSTATFTQRNEQGSDLELAPGLSSQVATTTRTNSTADALGPTVTVPGGTVLAGSVLTGLCFGAHNTSAAPPVFRFQFMVDGVQRLSTTYTPAASVNRRFRFDVVLVFRAIGAAAATWGVITVLDENAAAPNQVNVVADTAAVNIDTTASHTYDLRCNMQTAVAANTLELYGGYFTWGKY